ncbi:Uncharacterised protein [Mycolicibacterium smegmatis]|nr:Uncharacterised protein [Mycolicibacterium smegmatis]
MQPELVTKIELVASVPWLETDDAGLSARCVPVMSFRPEASRWSRDLFFADIVRT